MLLETKNRSKLFDHAGHVVRAFALKAGRDPRQVDQLIVADAVLGFDGCADDGIARAPFTGVVAKADQVRDGRQLVDKRCRGYVWSAPRPWPCGSWPRP